MKNLFYKLLKKPTKTINSIDDLLLTTTMDLACKYYQENILKNVENNWFYSEKKTKAWFELKEIVHWYQNEYSQYENIWDTEIDITADEYIIWLENVGNQEKEQFQKIEEMLIRLMKIRNYLW